MLQVAIKDKVKEKEKGEEAEAGGEAAAEEVKKEEEEEGGARGLATPAPAAACPAARARRSLPAAGPAAQLVAGRVPGLLAHRAAAAAAAAAAGEKPPPDGCGCVLYQTEDGHLAMAGVPAAQGAVQVGARLACFGARTARGATAALLPASWGAG